MYLSKTDAIGGGLMLVGGYILGGPRTALGLILVYTGVRYFLQDTK